MVLFIMRYFVNICLCRIWWFVVFYRFKIDWYKEGVICYVGNCLSYIKKIVVFFFFKKLINKISVFMIIIKIK